VAVRALYGAILWDALRHGEVHATSDMAGVACWLPPARAVLTLARQARCGMLRLPWYFGWRGFRRLLAYDATAARLHHEYASDPHWYLAAIGVVPHRQGRGLAAALVRPMLARACAQRVACYLETQHDQNVRIYERLGFRVVCQTQPPGHPIGVWAMKYAPP